MSEALHVCQALAAMLRSHGEVNEEEVRFVSQSALELGLTADENTKVQQVLKDGGNYEALLKEIQSKRMRYFLFRRVVVATLLDAQITEAEQAFIDKTAKAFGYTDRLVGEFLGWIRQGIDWERRGVELCQKM